MFNCIVLQRCLKLGRLNEGELPILVYVSNQDFLSRNSFPGHSCHMLQMDVVLALVELKSMT